MSRSLVGGHYEAWPSMVHSRMEILEGYVLLGRADLDSESVERQIAFSLLGYEGAPPKKRRDHGPWSPAYCAKTRRGQGICAMQGKHAFDSIHAAARLFHNSPHPPCYCLS